MKRCKCLVVILAWATIVALPSLGLAGPKKNTDVVVSDKDAKVLRVEAPRPQVVILIPRAVLSGPQKAAPLLAPRIHETIKDKPF